MTATICRIDERGVRHYPMVIIWKRGRAVATSPDTMALVKYPASVTRILWRTIAEGTVIATFHWSDQAWSCVVFENEFVFGQLVNCGVTFHSWPGAESLLS
jgi:hypothetical protein